MADVPCRLGHPWGRQSAATLGRCVTDMRQRLAKDGEIARSVLREVFPQSIWLEPIASGRIEWAVFADLLGAALFDQRVTAEPFIIVGESACVIAGRAIVP